MYLKSQKYIDNSRTGWLKVVNQAISLSIVSIARKFVGSEEPSFEAALEAMLPRDLSAMVQYEC